MEDEPTDVKKRALDELKTKTSAELLFPCAGQSAEDEKEESEDESEEEEEEENMVECSSCEAKEVNMSNCLDCDYSACENCEVHHSRGTCYCKNSNFGHPYKSMGPAWYHGASGGSYWEPWGGAHAVPDDSGDDGDY